MVDRDGWARAPAEASIAVEGDGARDRTTGIAIDVLFPGDDWEMVIPLPEPSQVREYDEDLGAWFIAPAPLVAIKTAVYLSKLAEYGEELAAKDLTDVVSCCAPTRNVRAILGGRAIRGRAGAASHLEERARALTARVCACWSLGRQDRQC